MAVLKRKRKNFMSPDSGRVLVAVVWQERFLREGGILFGAGR
jgi:hypothetical protein